MAGTPKCLATSVKNRIGVTESRLCRHCLHNFVGAISSGLPSKSIYCPERRKVGFFKTDHSNIILLSVETKLSSSWLTSLRWPRDKGIGPNDYIIDESGFRSLWAKTPFCSRLPWCWLLSTAYLLILSSWHRRRLRFFIWAATLPSSG